MQFSPYWFLWDKFHPEILTSYRKLGVKQGWGGEYKLVSSFVRQYLKNGKRYLQSYYWH